jgi:uncharacterized protein YkwD
MAAPTAQEQYFLELVNRARLNPSAEAQKYGIDLNKDLAAGTISASQKQPLAFNSALADAAAAHSNWMLAADVFSHTGSGGSTPTQRMQNAGYSFTGSWRSGENIAWTGTTGALDFNASVGQLHQNLFLSAGHRTNILDGLFKEIGISDLQGQFTASGTAYNASMVTEDFATSGSSSFVTGVAYNDTSGDKFYSIGEGIGGIAATLMSGSTTIGTVSTWAAGGYNQQTTALGGLTMTFSGGGLAAPLGVYFTMGAENVKIDLVNGNTIETSGSAVLVGAAANLDLLGINDTYAYGNALANTINGNGGNNTLAGLGGNDVLNGNGGNDFLMGGAGSDTLNGGDGIDWAYYGNSAAGVSVYLAHNMGFGGDAAGDTFSGIEYVWASAFDDLVFGTADANYINGDAGNDIMFGWLGGDTMDGGAGSDWAYYTYSSSAVYVYLNYGVGYGGEAAGDYLYNIENLSGSAYADALIGDAGVNMLNGGQGNDVITGGAGADLFTFLAAGFGNDLVTDFADGSDLLYFSSAVAANFAALTITGNGTTSVVVYAGGNSVTLQGPSPITLTANDFLFA